VVHDATWVNGNRAVGVVACVGDVTVDGDDRHLGGVCGEFGVEGGVSDVEIRDGG